MLGARIGAVNKAVVAHGPTGETNGAVLGGEELCNREGGRRYAGATNKDTAPDSVGQGRPQYSKD